ncbi:MAG: hypothetical protein V4721_09695, partial [Bacteroidota bacterium]
VGIPQRVKGIIVTVPSEFNPLQSRIVNRDSVGNWFIDKTHINYFDKQGLGVVLREAGFEPLWWGAIFPMEVFQLWLGQKYIGDDLVGQRVHLARLKFEKTLGRVAFNLYGQLFNRLSWGREIICIAKLKEK